MLIPVAICSLIIQEQALLTVFPRQGATSIKLQVFLENRDTNARKQINVHKELRKFF